MFALINIFMNGYFLIFENQGLPKTLFYSRLKVLFPGPQFFSTTTLINDASKRSFKRIVLKNRAYCKKNQSYR
jgi:hypothetical protein